MVTQELNPVQRQSLAFQKMLLDAQSEASPDGILVVSNERKWLSFNQRFLDMWHIPEQVAKEKESQLALQTVRHQVVNPEQFLAQIEHLYEHPDEQAHHEICLKDGRIFEQYGCPIRDTDGKLYGRVWYYRDITEHKEAEEKLRRQTAQLEALHQIGLELLTQLELDVLLKSIMSRLNDLLETDLGALSLYQPDKDVLEIMATNDTNTPLIGRTFQRGEGLAGKVWQSGGPIVIDDYQAWDGKLNSLADRIGHAAVAGVPIYWDNQVQGVISMSSGKKNYKFSESDVKLLSMFATQTAVALQNARLYEQTQQHALQLEKEIAEHEKTEKALHEHQRRYQALFEQTNDAVFIIGPDLKLGTELVHYAVNQQAADLLGYTVDELHQMPIKNIVAAETWDSSVQMAQTLSEARSVPVYERMMVKKDGTPIWVEINPLQVFDNDGHPLHVLSIVRDISERKQAEKALQQANSSLRQRVDELATLNQLSQTLATVTDMQNALQIVAKTMGQLFQTYNTVVSLYNEATAEIELVTQYSSDPNEPSLIGLTLPLTENTSTFHVIQTGKILVIPQPSTSPLTKHVHQLAQERNLQHLMSVPLRIRGTVVGIITMVRTDAEHPFTQAEEKLAETIAIHIAGAIEITRLFEETEHAREAAESANQAKSQFLATMSHELRTPLNGILGYAKILQRDTAVSSRHRAGLQIIEQSGEHLLLLINDILDLAKIEAGKIELQKTEFLLPTFLHNINEIMRIRAEEKRITFQLDMGTLPTAVHSDPKLLRQVLINLLGNAIKFTDKGNVTFSVHALDSENSTIPRFRFQIADTGCGIAPDDLQKIFEPFQQVGNSKSRAEGTGLGLTISHTLIALMGGELQVSSELEVGSTFWFDIPMDVLSSWAEVDTAVAPQNIIGIKDQPPAILIVDDSAENRTLLVDLLSPLGFAILEANNGLDALTIAQTSQPDAIILDLFMPQMDGFELIKHIRSTPEIKDIVIITTSADIHQDNLNTSMSLGSNAFVTKPIQIDKLLNLLQAHLLFDWIYQPLPGKDTKISPPVTYQLPPQANLDILKELTLQGDIAAIRQHASDLIKIDKNLEPFAAKLQQLAAQFQINEIYKWLGSFT